MYTAFHPNKQTLWLGTENDTTLSPDLAAKGNDIKLAGYTQHNAGALVWYVCQSSSARIVRGIQMKRVTVQYPLSTNGGPL